MFKDIIVDVNKREHMALEDKQASSEEKYGQGHKPRKYQYLKGMHRERGWKIRDEYEKSERKKEAVGALSIQKKKSEIFMMGIFKLYGT